MWECVKGVGGGGDGAEAMTRDGTATIRLDSGVRHAWLSSTMFLDGGGGQPCGVVYGSTVTCAVETGRPPTQVEMPFSRIPRSACVGVCLVVVV